MRIFFDFLSARAEVNMVDANLGFVNSLYAKERRQGHATQVMRDIADWADRKDVVLLITAQEFGKIPGLSNNELVRFYERFGFVVQDHRSSLKRMKRDPSQVLHAP